MYKWFFLLVISITQTAAQKMNLDLVQDVRGENTFYFKIHKDLPQFKFVLTGDSVYGDIIKIDIYKGAAKIPFQTIIPEMSEAPVKETEYFQTADFNFDVYMDIMLLQFWGATGNRIYLVYLYNPAKMIFESNESLQAVCLPEFNDFKKEITTYSKDGASDYTRSVYKFLNNKFVMIRMEIRDWDWKRGVTIEEKFELQNDGLKLISRREVKE